MRWKQRRRGDHNAAALRWIRYPEDEAAGLRVVESRPRGGDRRAGTAYAPRFYAQRVEQIAGRPVWLNISTHRTEAGALKACSRHAPQMETAPT